MNNIDLVIPYVDSSDINWQKLFAKYNPTNENIEAINAANRFRGQGDFFKYWFRCVERNMPWIRKIHLIVQSESQVPSWINRKEVNIVYHKDIIPEEYLPTFNSTCIEMFLWRIKDLSEYFIYSNDDFYAFSYIKPEAFFNFSTNNLKNNTLINRTFKNKHNMYVNHCLNAYCLVNTDINKETIESLPIFGHKMRPYFKSLMEEFFENNKETILNSLSKFREYKNINVYVFDYYNIKKNRQEPVDEIYNRIIDSKTTYSTIKMILNSKINMLAIQDTDTSSSNIYNSPTLNNWFNSH